jgi:maltooligosyltrehalose trehalohydrolase
MSEISVWAPLAGSVEIQIGSENVPMQRRDWGWWAIEDPGILPGRDYGFVLDGGRPLPDPRSQWQPCGVHGLSRIVDHGEFRWTDRHWQPRPLSSAVIYELHIGTFTRQGTFESAIACLDHLAELGVTHVELMPLAQFSGARGWGYDGVDLYAPHNAYGGPNGLKSLVDACHARGLAVIIDVVYNHLGPDGNYLGQFGPYFTTRHTTPWGQAVNFDGPGSYEVRRFFIDNALMWLRDYHADGLRLDAVHAILDTSATHVLEQLAAEVKILEARLGRHLVLIAESDLNDPRLIRRPEVGGYGLDAQWNDDFHHALHTVLTGEQNGYYADFGAMQHLAKALTRGFVYDGCYSPFRERLHGRPATGISGHQFIAYLQNHDQIGNRALGDRSHHLMGPGLAKIGAAVLFTSPFVPMLFQGEEWGAAAPFQYFTSHEDPDLGCAVSEGRKREFASFGWTADEVPDPQDPATYERSKLDWAELPSAEAEDMLAWHRALIEFRNSTPDLLDGRIDKVTAYFDEAGSLTIRRGSVVVECNLGETDRTCPAGPHSEPAMHSDKRIRREGDGFILPGQSVLIYRELSSSKICQPATAR